MTDDTTTDELTPEQAEAELAQLEQAVIDGGSVTAEQITTARERISFAQLVAKGKAARAAAAREREADQLRAETKAQAASTFADRESNGPTVLYERAVRALEDLLLAVEQNNELIEQTKTQFDRGGVKPLGWDYDQTGVDLSNYASVAQGDVATSVTVDGKVYRKETPAVWAIAAFRQVADDHDLRKPGGARLDLGDKNVPLALQERG